MKGYILVRHIFFPAALAAALALLFKTVYMTDGQVDYFLAWVLIGFPFGIRKMMLLLVPSHFGLAGTIGVFALDVILGGIIGGIALVAEISKGTVMLIKSFF